LREGINFFIQGNVYEEFERCVKRPCKRAALSIGALFGETRGGSFNGTSERKRKCVSGFLFWDPEDIKS
jgi:hypothetical protein